MPVTRVLVPEGTHMNDWRCLGPFHFNTGPVNGFSTDTTEVWHDARRDVLGFRTRLTKTKSRISDLPETSGIAQAARARIVYESAFA